MNRKMIAMVMLVVVGVLAVSAFSWTTDHDSNHQGMAIYYQSERANYTGISALGFNQLTDIESARWMGAALASQAQATEQQIMDVESARWMGAALASQVQVVAFHYTSPGR
jgi:hypothetical protein